MPETVSNRQAGKGSLSEGAIFAGALLDPQQPIPVDVTDTSGAPSVKRFSVYRNNVVVSLMDALGAAYPSIKAIMGDDNFSKVARLFVAKHPPRSAMMQDFGAGFADFLAGFQPVKSSPFLADVARCERLWLEAYHARNEPVLAPEALGAIAPEDVGNAVFSVRSASRLVVSQYPVADLFSFRFQRPEAGVNLEESQSILLTRPELDVEIRLLDEAASSFLQTLFDGETLGVAISNTMETDPNADVSALVSLLLESGMASAANLPSPPGSSAGEGD